MNTADIEKLCGPCQDLRACWAFLGIFQVLVLCVHRYVPYPFEPVRWFKRVLFQSNVTTTFDTQEPPRTRRTVRDLQTRQRRRRRRIRHVRLL